MLIDWSDAPKFGRTFAIRYALEQLHAIQKKKPVIVETGTTRGSLGGGWKGDGWATLAFAWYAKTYGGKVYTVDMDKEAIDECKALTEEYKDVITYVVGDSAKWLGKYKFKIDFLYLDSADDPEVALAEVKAAYHRLNKTSIIVIDDTHENMTRGKGTLAGPWLTKKGWTILEDYGGSVILISPDGDFPVSYEMIQYIHEKGVHYSIHDYDGKARVWHDIFFNFLPPRDNLPRVRGYARALDLGCNTGYNVRELQNKYGWAAGVDINQKLIEVSRLNADRCYVGRAEDLHMFEDESMCIVTAKDVFEHCSDPDAALSESYRVLVDGGYLVTMIPLDGEPFGVDDVTSHSSLIYNNPSHIWKATADGVMRRLLELGFTDFEHRVDSHSALFGVDRSYGDRVMTVRARKDKNITKVPFMWLNPSAYLAAFITLTCNGNCKYCIQKFHPKEFTKAQIAYARGELTPREWIEFWNKLQRHKGARLSIVGGEPTIHYGFFDIVNGIENYYKTITTNLSTPAFEDVDRFAANIKDKNNFRLNTSFHPHLIGAKEFCDRIHKLRFHGIFVDQIAMVDYPFNNWKQFYYEFLQYGLVLQPQTFTGKISGQLLPSEGGVTQWHGDFPLDDYNRYRAVCGQDEPTRCFCCTTRLLAAPDGGIYRCHKHLYDRENKIGNILDDELPTIRDFTLCDDFGQCNPCDYGQMSTKSELINIPDVLNQIVRGVPGVAAEAMKVIAEHLEDIKEVLEIVSTELNTGIDPYWTLYNSEKITNAVSDLVETSEGGRLFMDKFAQIVFPHVQGGVNIYRILRQSTLKKVFGGSNE